MVKAIKSWYSPKIKWKWHAKSKVDDRTWFGYVDGFDGEWGHFTNNALKIAGAVEITPEELPRT